MLELVSKDFLRFLLAESYGSIHFLRSFQQKTLHMQGGNELYRLTFRGCSGIFVECSDIRNPWSPMTHYRVITEHPKISRIVRHGKAKKNQIVRRLTEI